MPYTSTLPCSTVFAYLNDDNLELVESEAESSIYTYDCGCLVVHWLIKSDCYVEWCIAHQPRPHMTA